MFLPSWRLKNMFLLLCMSLTIHVWYIYLHLVDFNGKIWYMSVNIPYMDDMGVAYCRGFSTFVFKACVYCAHCLLAESLRCWVCCFFQNSADGGYRNEFAPRKIHNIDTQNDGVIYIYILDFGGVAQAKGPSMKFMLRVDETTDQQLIEIRTRWSPVTK